MEEGVVLLSFTHLGSFRQKKATREASSSKKRNLFQLKTLTTILNKLLSKIKLNTENAGSREVSYSKKAESLKSSLVFENEIERFHRDFILPLENWEQDSEACSEPCGGKPSLSPSSDYDSGHFSGDLESVSFSSAVSTISEVTVKRVESEGVVVRPGHLSPACPCLVTVNGVCYQCHDPAQPQYLAQY